MSIIGKPRACNIKNANTGQASCDTKVQKLTMLLLARDGFAIPASETNSFEGVLAYLQQATLAKDPKKRIYPIKTIQGYTENTEAADTIKSGFGIVDMESAEISDYFPEFFKLKEQCKFRSEERRVGKEC